MCLWWKNRGFDSPGRFISPIGVSSFMLERQIESRLRLGVLALGGKAYKFLSPGNNGVPDRIVLIMGKCYFVELKKPGKDLEPLQRAVRKDFARLGFKVYKFDTLTDVEEFLKEVDPGAVHTARIPKHSKTVGHRSS